jgi:hypothetical protein
MSVTAFDPYDLWALPFCVEIRKAYYVGNNKGKFFAIVISLADLAAPVFLRRVLQLTPQSYPILSAHECIRALLLSGKTPLLSNVHELRSQSVNPGNEYLAWGLGFSWMSKNGLYGPEIPFITHTPYVMEALLALSATPTLHQDAMNMFDGTWAFLESLKVMYEDDAQLALSYAPIDEPRIVINANAYAAFAYALHAIHGKPEVRELARLKSLRLTRWVVSQQSDDGSWLYYADHEHGNFIDGFHSCFVVKNLIKVERLLPDIAPLISGAIQQGWTYIQSTLFDDKAGLCRRFAQRSHLDPFKWDLYDQAEYLGLLVDFDLLENAREFAAHVERRFKNGQHWYCRIDVFGRRWGRDFLRWGIVPFQYHQARLERALKEVV